MSRCLRRGAVGHRIPSQRQRDIVEGNHDRLFHRPLLGRHQTSKSFYTKQTFTTSCLAFYKNPFSLPFTNIEQVPHIFREACSH